MAIRIGTFGFWCGIAAAGATIAYVVVQVLQVAGLLAFPSDEILIYGTSLCIVVPFLLEMLAFHHTAVGERRYWTHAALLLTLGYAIFVTANYVVQLATVLPARVRGEGESLRLLEQTPHSLFWDFDAIGYILMGLAALAAVPALDATGVDRWARRACVAHALVTPLIAVVYFYPTFSAGLLFLGFPWALTAPLFMAAIAIRLRAGADAREGGPDGRIGTAA